jgi:hypothetical protein
MLILYSVRGVQTVGLFDLFDRETQKCGLWTRRCGKPWRFADCRRQLVFSE